MEQIYELLKKYHLDCFWNDIHDNVFIERNSGRLSTMAFENLNLYLACYYILNLEYFYNSDKPTYNLIHYNNDSFYLKSTENCSIEIKTDDFRNCLCTFMETYSEGTFSNFNFLYYYEGRTHYCNNTKCFRKHLNINLDNLSVYLNTLQESKLKNKIKKVQSIKQDVKNKIKKKFVIGKKYSLRILNRHNNFDAVYKTFILKKFAYKIKDREFPILIMKQIDGPLNGSFSLNKKDCLLYHLKYEDGLQVFSMDLPFKEI